ncbi:hypothetical protein ACOMHN_059272 [Nucella lapillus]
MNNNTAQLDARMDKLESDLFDLKNEKDTLLTEVKQLREENKTLRDQVGQCQKEAAAFKRDLNDLEQQGQQFNIRVYGVLETEGCTETADNCMKECADIFTANAAATAADVILSPTLSLALSG